MSSQRPPYSFEPDPNVTVRATLVNTNTLEAGTANIASTLVAGNIITGNYDIADGTVTDLSSTRIQTQRLEADTDIIFRRNLTGDLNTNETFSDVSQRVFVLENQELELIDISQRIYDLSEYTHNEFNIVHSDISDLSGRHDDLSSHVDTQVTRLDSDISDLSGRHDDLSSHVDTQVTRLDSDISDLSGRHDDLSSHVDTQVTRLDSDIIDISDRVLVNEGDITDISQRLFDSQAKDDTDILDISDRVLVNEGDITDISQRLFDSQAKDDTDILDISDRVLVNEGDITDLSGRHDDLSSHVDLQITRLDSDISDLSGRLTDLSYSLGATIQSELIPLISIVDDISQKNLDLSNNVNTNIIQLDTDISDLSGRVNTNEDTILSLLDSTEINRKNLGVILLGSVSGDISGFITISGEENQNNPPQDVSNGDYLISSSFSPGTNTTLVIDGKSNNYNHIKINTFQREKLFNMKVVILDISGITGVSVSTYSNDTFDVSTNSIYRTGGTLSNLPIHTTELYHHGVDNEKVFTTFDIGVIKIPTRENSIVVISDNFSQAQS